MRSRVTKHRFIPGYWETAPEAYVRDTMVLTKLLETHAPDASKKLLTIGVVPESYISKWWVGLCIHMLPMEALALYFETFLQEVPGAPDSLDVRQGHVYLFNFGVTIMQTLTDRIMAAGPMQVCAPLFVVHDPGRSTSCPNSCVWTRLSFHRKTSLSLWIL